MYSPSGCGEHRHCCWGRKALLFLLELLTNYSFFLAGLGPGHTEKNKFKTEQQHNTLHWTGGYCLTNQNASPNTELSGRSLGEWTRVCRMKETLPRWKHPIFPNLTWAPTLKVVIFGTNFFLLSLLLTCFSTSSWVATEHFRGNGVPQPYQSQAKHNKAYSSD